MTLRLRLPLLLLLLMSELLLVAQAKWTSTPLST